MVGWPSPPQVAFSSDNTLKVWDVASGKVLATYPDEADVTCCAANGAGGVLVMGDYGGRVHFLRLENVSLGPAVVTAWRAPHSLIQQIVGRPVRPAFGCPACRAWSEVPASALGTELPCPRCGKPVRLNPFVIEADWRPVAAAWRGETMTTTSRTFRIFVSSTFSDLVAERNALQERVFPRLRDLCQQHGAASRPSTCAGA